MSKLANETEIPNVPLDVDQFSMRDSLIPISEKVRDDTPKKRKKKWKKKKKKNKT